MRPKDIMENGDNYKMASSIWFCLYKSLKIVQLTETENRMTVSRGWGL